MYRGDISSRYVSSIFQADSDLTSGTACQVEGPTNSREEPVVAKRSDVLVLAVLGILHESPMHGYELRKRCNAVLGSFRAFSYGSLYPCLKSLQAAGWIAEDPDSAPVTTAKTATPKRSRTVYRLTAEGKEHFQELVGESGPSAWEDDGFGVHFAFFGRTDAETRLRILEGRRSRLEERMAGVRAALARTRERVDGYTLELQRHGLESVEREVRWLTELIETERSGTRADLPSTTPDLSTTQHDPVPPPRSTTP
jgi:DNA-binding PadR family transcriptional regulator